MTFDEPVREMDVEECWDFLASQELGRLAFRLVDETHIVPVNYVVDDGTLLFRTAAGNKLFGVELGGQVAFEVDVVEGETARSVVVRGRARRLSEAEAHRVELLPLHVWVDTRKDEVVAIEPLAVTGREIALHRPWRRLRPAE